MAKASHIKLLGDALAIVIDDGRNYMAYPTPGNIFLMRDSFDVIDVAPDPGEPGNPDPQNPGTPGEWQWPFQYTQHVFQTGDNARLAQFGMRVNPVSGVYRLHAGLDFGAGGIGGMDIPCAKDGTVIYADYSSGEGNSVHVDHGGGITTRYFHMRNNTMTVAVGDTVTKGQKLGNVGTTGNSTGEHLHWETRVNGEPINPRDFMRERGVPES